MPGASVGMDLLFPVSEQAAIFAGLRYQYFGATSLTS